MLDQRFSTAMDLDRNPVPGSVKFVMFVKRCRWCIRNDCRTEIPLAFIAAALLFLPLFVFLPKLIQRAMKADADAAIEAFGKNEHVRKIFWTVFVAMAGLVLARVLDPGTAQQILSLITSGVP